MAKLNLRTIAAALSALTIPLAHAAHGALDSAPTAAPAAQDLRRQAADPSTSSSVVTLHLANFDPQTLHASVITANPTATSYFLACASDAPDDECGLEVGAKVLEGPSTLEVHLTLGTSYTSDMTCRLNGDAADCRHSSRGPDGNMTADMHYGDIRPWAMPVTVTAGFRGPGVCLGRRCQQLDYK